MRERIGQARINLNTATEAELLSMEQHARARLEEAKTDVFVIEDYRHRRFGRVADNLIRLDDYRKGQSDREFELNLFDDEPA